MFTLIALAIALASVLLMLGGLRLAAQDAFAMLSKATAQARHTGELMPRMAFATLWIMIFVLSYI